MCEEYMQIHKRNTKTHSLQRLLKSNKNTVGLLVTVQDKRPLTNDCPTSVSVGGGKSLLKRLSSRKIYWYVNVCKMDKDKEGLEDKQCKPIDSQDEPQPLMTETGTRESKEVLKRQRDAIKKRMLRSSAEYRHKEAEKAKLRIANKRKNNPDFRETERQKDRNRRAQARKDLSKRNKERQRDREYRRQKRAFVESPDKKSGT